MKKRLSASSAVVEPDELREEYVFDYRRSRPNRFAKLLPADCVSVILEPDVAAAFPDSKSVNEFLRSILAILPRRVKSRSGRKKV